MTIFHVPNRKELVKEKMDNIPTSNSNLRKAIYEAFEGKCFYTGRPMKREDMVIDHVLPKSKGGMDSLFNYVLTSQRLNAQKNAKLDEGLIGNVSKKFPMVSNG